jgi:hypothetical protein
LAGLLDKLRGDGDAPLNVEFSNEFGDELEKDPSPGKPTRGGAKMAAPATKTAKPARKPATATVRKQVADELHAYLEMAAMTWALRDEHCGGALSDASREIAERLADIVSTNPQLVEWLHTSGLVGNWIALLMACKPVLSAVRAHHVTKSVGGEDGPALDPARFPAYRPA